MEAFKLQSFLLFLAAFLLVLTLIQAEDTGATITEDDTMFVDEAEAKAYRPRRVKRGWRRIRIRVKRITGEERKEERESRSEQARRDELNRFCTANCWSQWTPYSPCSVQCGHGGTRTRTRSKAPPARCSGWAAGHNCNGPSLERPGCSVPCSNGGTPGNAMCSCSPGFIGKCCETKVTCQHPGRPAHGDVTPSAPPHDVGTRVTYKCETGYRLQGTNTRTCQANGQFDGSLPTCSLVDCGDPGTPTKGNHSVTATTYQGTVSYSCSTGYKVQGDTTRTCQADGTWSGELPQCQIISCGALPGLENGVQSHSGGPPGNVYGGEMTFSCNSGFYLQGSRQRKCQLSGQWDGTQPTCEPIVCPDLTDPQFGTASTPQGTRFGSKVTYTCDSGYMLQGDAERTCEAQGIQGVWSGSKPQCTPVDCGDPGLPQNGVKTGSDYTFGNEVNFQCQPGYFLQGSDKITCTASGQWSAKLPNCSACPLNQYKPGVNSRISCVPCPENSHTLDGASTDVTQCICNYGYEGPAGGPCSEIRCPALNPPDHGSIAACQTAVNDTCTFQCDPGYIFGTESESATKVCKIDATWTGGNVTCLECPVNTYKSDPTSCDSCPALTNTNGTVGNVISGCVCDGGYRGPGGGPCDDIDECVEDNGAGCNQTCENTPGSYRCLCTIPGYRVHPVDSTLCEVEKQCSVFGIPENGGSVCHHEFLTNTDRCQVKCNKGFEYVERTNAFEVCGPATNWQWSYEINKTPVTGCVEQFFPGVELEAEIAYFVDDCVALTSTQRREAKQALVDILEQRGVCKQNGVSVCNISDVQIECGPQYSFGGVRKRDTSGNILWFRFKIKTQQKPSIDLDCTKYCNGSENCGECAQGYMTETENMMNNQQKEVQEIFSPVGSQINETAANVTEAPIPPPVLKIGTLVLNPVPNSFKMDKNMSVSCEDVMEVRGTSCVPCPAGRYLPPGGSTCHKCPPGTFQIETQQTFCLPCPRGFLSLSGASDCSPLFKIIFDFIKHVGELMDSINENEDDISSLLSLK
ncbi:sushi, von Willebrand factor type A, EGF and pentraxin domain-containing protein 1 isoform X2 [Lingula anatina]|uniref:Sushi, von Willebrand factor type A, EGF and pentraxin domain-containing protein 1 isoform X2 n=1 Tax=Lingula anatina TaxID=7574 RepID=A0A1S3IF90_LINAN|nr:sushi, von Willebrand factor type A, EGF and pentraxin domain-containing protein 1 isoform X2 [Lingula anatina]|eukprot:XP_013396521.1 sushi, von Willebrand factor type A, EGF and pentraxin domain-containing protein 1 isoform X2 [Lingula anatina]